MSTSADTFRTLFEMNPQPMLVVDPHTHRVIALNEAAVRKYGYSRPEFLSLTAESIFPLLTPSNGSGPNFTGVWPHRGKSGSTLAAEVVQSDVSFEGRPAILVISKDVSSQQRGATERKLRFAIGELLAKGEDDAATQAIQVLSEWLECDQEAVVAVDSCFKVIYWNAAAEALFGRPASQVVGREYLVGAGGIFPREEIVVHRVEAQRNGRWKAVITCADGENRPALVIETLLSALVDNHGNVRGFLGIHHDVTHRRQRRENAVRAHERRKRRVAHGVDLGVWQMDLRTGESRWCRDLCRIYGMESGPAVLTPTQWFERIHPDDREFFVRILASSEPPEMLDHQYRIIWPDGSIHWLHTKATTIKDGNMHPSKLIGVDLDITPVKRAEMSNSEFAAIVEFSDLAIFSTDLAGNVVNWNSGAERIFGYNGEEIAGCQVRMLAAMEDRRPFDEIGERLRRGQKTEHRELICIAKTGERVQILLSAAPILDQSRTAVGGAYIMWDVTELKMLQRQLVQAQKLESIGQLAAGIAHEINTPIQYIGDNAKFLDEGCRDLFRLADAGREIAERLRAAGQPVAEWDSAAGTTDLEYLRGEVPLAIEQLLQGVDHVARIVRAMREFSHPSSVEMALVDLNRAIESTALVSKNEWKYVADLTTDLDPQLPTVPCVAGEFNQVILNLVVNASHAIADVVKGTDRKGTIRIMTRRRDPFVEIRVIDSGSGIPEKIQSKVFDPFFTTKDVGKGTGQGLAIAHSVIVQKHHGTIRFETKEGEGTTFIIQLPLKRGSDER